MGAGCCKIEDEFNPDRTPKDPQTKEQKKEDAKELRRAALSADWAQMRVLLRRMPLRQICSGADKSDASEEDLGNTALHYSVSINHLRGVKKLLRYGIPPRVVNKAGKTPLHLALESGKLKAARILLEASITPRSDGNSSTVAAPAPKLQAHLINLKDVRGMTPLLAVVAAGRLKLAREVVGLCKELDVSIDYDTFDKEGNSLLLYAAKWGWVDELEAWIRSSRVPQKLLNVQNNEGETVLGHLLMFRASGLINKQRCTELVAKLLELGALAKLPCFKEKVPPINLAAAADDKEVYSLLVSKGADPLKSKDVLGRSPLHFAAAKGAKLLAAELLDAGIKAYALDGQGNTPLHLAAMRGRDEVVTLLLERADNKVKALLTPNKSGLTAYHLALTAGPDDKAQRNSLALIEELGERFLTPVLGAKQKVDDTPLLLAIQGHQDKVVRALLQKGCSPNERNAARELPLARVLRCATAATYDKDSVIFDQLMAAGAEIPDANDPAHPLLALCKNNLSPFAEKVMGVLTERFAAHVKWEGKRDEKGYTPLALAAYHDNAWLVRYLIDTVGIDPNSEAQRTEHVAPAVVGTTGGMCSAKPILSAGTVKGQTPLMCAAKGASVAAVQLLLNRKADVHAVDDLGRTALQHAMHFDKAASLQVAAALLQMGARPERGVKVSSDPNTGDKAWQPCIDLVGEYWPHRAVRYGASAFLALWAECGGGLDGLLATTADDADDMPGAELKAEEKTDFLDIIPSRVSNALDVEDEELPDEYNGEDSEQAPAGEDKEGDGTTGAQPIAEGVESDDDDSGDDCGEEDERGGADAMAELLASGEVETFYSGPTPQMIKKWRRRGMQWWDEFWVDGDSLPDPELEDDPHWEDKYNICDEGEQWIDEEDVEEEIWEKIRAEQSSAAKAASRAAAAAAAAEKLQQQQQHDEEGQPLLASMKLNSPEEQDNDGGGSEGVTGALLARASSGLAHKLFRHRLPNAAIPEPSPRSGDGTLASGSPTNWLIRRKSSSSFGASATGTAQLSSQLSGRLRSGSGAGPVAEGREDAMQVMDVEEPADEGAPALKPSQSSRGLPPSGASSMNSRSSLGSRSSPAGGSNGKPAVLRLSSGGSGEAAVPAAAKRASGGGASDGTAMSQGGPSFGQSLSLMKGKLTSGASGERMYGNEPYYKPDSLYDGLPRYMKVPTEAHPKAKYDKYVTDLEARVASYKAKDDMRLEGPELRARNMKWYHKSMSPAEYPLKLGKWKSLQRMSAKAVEQARQRRPLKPGEKPQIRQKKVWFGLPPMPSRSELALTSPLVYAVRLGRVKCVEVLLRCGGDLPDVPDAHGVTPLSYALFLLAKDRYNKDLQQIVDLLLTARPRVDLRETWEMYLRPRMEQQLKALEERVALGGEKVLSKADRQTLKELRTTIAFLTLQGTDSPPNYARLFPSLMDPLILALLLNDVGRATFLIKQLGANPNNVWVWLPDIPTYCQGLMEKQLARCHSRCLALHVAICQKQYETVRALLDLGADPNCAGEEYSGDNQRDRERKVKLAQQKQKELQEQLARVEKPNPYVKLWSDKTQGLRALLMAAKHFISRIEIPGLSRPHPWLSPLHLACRLGQADVAFLLLKRGAAPNGGPSAAHAPKSPLEEALMYARQNAQAYGTQSKRATYNHILEEACLIESTRMADSIRSAVAEQAEQHAEFVRKLEAHANNLAASGAKGKNGKPATGAELLLTVRGLTASSLVKYDPESLRYIVVPGMNAAVLESRAMKAYEDVMAMMDPVKGSIKAVTLAAKIIIRILLDMLKRPIAHHDPALACAHVMLTFRAPINVSEKQTGIVMRDILDNGNCIGESDRRRSYYRWLGIEPSQVQEDIWVQTVVNKVTVLKANVAYGYPVMDMAETYKQYDKAKKKFLSQVEGTILSVGTSSVMPHYMRKIIQDVIKPTSASAAGTTPAASSGGWRPGSLEATLDALLDLYIQSAVKNAASADAGAESQAAKMDEEARKLLPLWIYDAPPPPANDAAAIVLSATSGREDVKRFIITRFMRYSSTGARAQMFLPPPVDAAPGEKVLQSKELKIEKPTIPQKALDEVQPTQDDLPDADICTAVVRAYNALLVQRVTSRTQALAKLQNVRSSSAASKRALLRSSKKLGVSVKAQLSGTNIAGGKQAFDEQLIFQAAIENPKWEAASVQLGDTAATRAFMSRLRAAQSSGELPTRITNPLELVKGLGENPMEQGPGVLLAGLEAGLRAPLPAKLRSDLARIASQTKVPGGGGEPDAYIDAAYDKAMQVAEFAQTDGAVDTAVNALKNDPRVAPTLKILGQLSEGSLDVDLDALMREGVEEIAARGTESAAAVWQEKLGPLLPGSSREQVEQCAQGMAAQITAAYQEGGVEGALSAARNMGAAAVTAAQSGAPDVLEGGVERVQSGVQRASAVVSELADGNMSALLDENGGLVLPMPKKLAPAGVLVAAVAGAGGIDAVADELTGALQRKTAEGMVALDEGHVALEAALSGGDFSGLAAMKGRLSVLAVGALTAALAPLLAEFRAQLVAEHGEAGDEAANTLERLTAEVEEGVAQVAERLQRLAAAVSGFASGEGMDALAEQLGEKAEELMQLLEEKGTEAVGQAAAAGLQALQDPDALAETLQSGMDTAVEGCVSKALSGRLRLLKHPLTKQLLGQFVDSQLLPAEIKEMNLTVESEILQAAQDCMTGLELDLGVDVTSLIEMLEEAREVLMSLLETLSIDEVV